MKKLVSIIIPVYNVEKYIRICLDSVLNQTYENIEIILVDDGSTDASSSICDEYANKDLRIKVIHKKNEGVSIARNVGIDIATGDYLCFADSDDILMPDYVEYLMWMIEQNDVEIAVTTSFFTTFEKSKSYKDNINNVSGEDAVAAILYYHIPIGCYCKMFSRRFLNVNHIRFLPDVYIGEGFNFNVEAFSRAKKVAIGHKKVYYYRRDNMGSAMTYFKIEKARMALKAIDIIRERLIIKSDKLLRACDFAKWHTSGDMLNWMVLSHARTHYPEFFNSCLVTVKEYAKFALSAPLNKKERLRAILQIINPLLLSYLLVIRRWLIIKNK